MNCDEELVFAHIQINTRNLLLGFSVARVTINVHFWSYEGTTYGADTKYKWHIKTHPNKTSPNLTIDDGNVNGNDDGDDDDDGGKDQRYTSLTRIAVINQSSDE